MAADKATELLRHGKGDHEVMSGQLSIQLFCQPFMGLMMLAVWAMSIAAGAVNGMLLAAPFALKDACAVIIGAAVYDGIDDFEMLGRHGFTKAFNVLWAEGLKDIFNCRHGHLLSSGR